MRIALACLLIAVCYAVAPAGAADLSRKSKIAAPEQAWTPPQSRVGAPEEPAYKVHNWYIGGVGAYDWGIRELEDHSPGKGKGHAAVAGDQTWSAGVVGGYLWRSGVLGLGVEADYMVRDLGHFSLDDATASLRGRAGMFLANGAFVYGTAGIAQATAAAAPAELRKGLVIGGGIEKDIVANVAVRAEVLHYRHGDGYFEWADASSTAVRAGVVFKF